MAVAECACTCTSMRWVNCGGRKVAEGEVLVGSV
jgi:hypothetical protein